MAANRNRRKSLTGGAKDLKVFQLLRSLTSPTNKDGKNRKTSGEFSFSTPTSPILGPRSSVFLCTSPVSNKKLLSITEPSWTDALPIATVAPMKTNHMFLPINEHRSKSFSGTTNMQESSVSPDVEGDSTMLSSGVLDSLVYIQESFPQYTTRYLNECLKHYKYNVEDLMNALKKVSLPTIEKKTARSPEKIYDYEDKTESKSSLFSEYKQTNYYEPLNITLIKENIENDTDEQPSKSAEPNQSSGNQDDLESASNIQRSSRTEARRNIHIQTITYVKADFDCNPGDEDELHFKMGDVIRIIDKPHKAWWMGEINGRKGLFPSNYVREYKVEEILLSPPVNTAQLLPTLDKYVDTSCINDLEIDDTIKPQLPLKKHISSPKQSHKKLIRVNDAIYTCYEDDNIISTPCDSDEDKVDTIKPILPLKKHISSPKEIDEIVLRIKDSMYTFSEEGNAISGSYNFDEEGVNTVKPKLPPKKLTFTAEKSDETVLTVQDLPSKCSEDGNISSQVFDVHEKVECSIKRNLYAKKKSSALEQSDNIILAFMDSTSRCSEHEFRCKGKSIDDTLDQISLNVQTLDVNHKLDCNSKNHTEDIDSLSYSSKSESAKYVAIVHAKKKYSKNLKNLNVKSKIPTPKYSRYSLTETNIAGCQENIKKNFKLFEPFIDTTSVININSGEDFGSLDEKIVTCVKPTESKNTARNYEANHKVSERSLIRNTTEPSTHTQNKPRKHYSSPHTNNKSNGKKYSSHKLSIPSEKESSFHTLSIPSGIETSTHTNTIPCEDHSSTYTHNKLNEHKSRDNIHVKESEHFPRIEERYGDSQLIQLTKSDKGLGFTITGNEDPQNPHKILIEIKTIKPDSVADKDGRLSPGDRLEAINGILVNNGTFDYAVATLKGVPKGTVSLCIRKRD